ncbi:MAG: hypothetical protein LBJ67_01725 [Planctomycetaceae bacterium]|jgi:hypothetical protein|nr:hypothetical protein [Planctomycetaceae bacterium]
MKKIFLILSCMFLVFGSIGCSRNIKITGHVTFNDGESVNFGRVVFETPENSFTGKLNEQGYYTVGVDKDGTGIPPGNYTVWLAGTADVKFTATKGNKGGDNETFDSEETPRVHEKYTTPHSSNALKFEVKRGGAKTFDFTVERPQNTQVAPRR